jgi:hypothetical protein
VKDRPHGHFVIPAGWTYFFNEVGDIIDLVVDSNVNVLL